MKPTSPLGPRTLTGDFIALEPLAREHREGLLAAAKDPSIWTFIPIDPVAGFAGRLGWLERENAKGAMYTFAVRRIADAAIVGSTSYLSLSPENARVEIGFTWYRPDVQASVVNPEAKYLLLANAFASDFNRVEFKTDARNARSRAALKKLGAIEEGTMRGHMWVPQGYFRDSVYFSILASDWPRVSADLKRRLDGFR